jgi:pimeloyl-ACP methyl ester carboxylesterase
MKLAAAKLAIAGYEFHCVQRGEGKPVLFVHGSVSDYRTWQPQLEAFAQRFRAIAYSRRYHWPNTPIATSADYAMRVHVDDLEAVIGSLGIAPVHLVGHSYGAFLCLLLACRRPDLVRSLVLAEPPLVTLLVSNAPRMSEILRLFATSPRTAMALLKFGASGLGPATAAFRAGDVEKGLRIFGTAVLGREAFQNLSDARLRQARDNLIVAEFLGSGFVSVDPGEMRRIEDPTLLVTGARSPALFHRLTDRLEELLRRVQRVEIPQASHVMHEDNAPAFNAAVLSFLACR